MSKVELFEIAGEVHNFWQCIEIVIVTYNVRKQREAERTLKQWLDFIGAESGSLLGCYKWQQAGVRDSLAFKELLQSSRGRNGANGEELPVSSATVRTKIAILRKMSERLFTHGLLKINIFDQLYVTSPKLNTKFPTKVLSDGDIQMIYESINQKDLWRAERNEMIVYTMLHAALRVGEVGKIRIYDVKLTSSGSIYLVLRDTKSGVDQMQSLGKSAGEKIYSYRQKRLKESGGDKTRYLFSRDESGVQFKLEGVRDMLKKLMKKSGVNAGTHAIRKTAISRLIKNDVSLQKVRRFARHESIATTLIYEEEEKNLDNSTASELDKILG
jgi:site-specific recombinase XerD